MPAVDTPHRRYASMADYEAGNAMGPRELVEDVIRRQTDGSLTFRLDEDVHTVAAAVEVGGGRWITQAWSKATLADDPYAADHGLRNLLVKANAHA